ncbi:MAG: hypothetical protein CMM73_03415 [Rhodospirillaceae bacterium]|nr:hypothetical protein [Rhodospirillaceae bacterium]
MTDLPRLTADRITTAVSRLFMERGAACIREFTVRTGRRVDLMVLGNKRDITIVEVKSSRQDFTSDTKWPDYIEWADKFYFAVAEDFPLEILPGSERCGIIITDGFDCHIVQKAPAIKLATARRTHLVTRMAQKAMRRLEGVVQTAGDIPLTRAGPDSTC